MLLRVLILFKYKNVPSLKFFRGRGQSTWAKQYVIVKYVTLLLLLCPPPWGVDILFLCRPMSGVRCPASRMVSAHLKEKY